MLQTLGVDTIAGGGLAMQFYNQIRTMCVGMVTAAGNLAVGMRRPGSLLVVTLISIGVNADANAFFLWAVSALGWTAA